MAKSLLQDLSGLVTPQLLSEASRSLGESEGSLTTGLGSSFATILAGLSGKASNPQAMTSVLDLINNPANDSSILKDPRLALATGAAAPLGSLGGTLLSSLFGSRLGSIGDVIGRSAGLKAGTGASLLNMAAPLVLALLGSRARSGGLNPAGLGSLLLGEKADIMRALPSGLSSLIGVEDTVRAGAAALPSAPSTPRWLWPALAALALIAVIWMLRSRRPSGAETVGAVTASLPATFRCGDQSISIDQVDDRTVLTSGTETFTLQHVPAASGAKYQAEGDPATTFWNKGDQATVAIRGQTLPECTRAR